MHAWAFFLAFLSADASPISEIDPLDLALLEDALDDDDPTGARLERVERRLTDRIVRFGGRTNAITLAARGSIQWSDDAPVRRQHWGVSVVLDVHFDAFLVPPARTLGVPRLERERQARCLDLASQTGGSVLERRSTSARFEALACGGVS